MPQPAPHGRAGPTSRGFWAESSGRVLWAPARPICPSVRSGSLAKLYVMRPSMRYASPLWLRGFLGRVEVEMTASGLVGRERSMLLAHLKRFYLARGRPVPWCTPQEVQSWLLYLHRRGNSSTYVDRALTALRFVHEHVLEGPREMVGMPRPGQWRSRRAPTMVGTAGDLM
jgi:hypothetical protein